MTMALTGKRAEDIAARFLKEKGYVMLARNFRCCLGELDIIAKDAQEFVFCEVRSRTERSFISEPAESVTGKKTERIRLMALLWLESKKIIDPMLRFDFIAVSFSLSGDHSIEHIKNAF